MIVDAYKPYGLLGLFIDALPNGLTPDMLDPDLYQEAYQRSNYKMKIETVINKF